MILVTDHMFPSKYAKWRIEGLKAMVDMGYDILVNKVQNFADITYNIDYEEMKEYYKLNNYNILIFDKKYNNLNKYNKHVDGTLFNNMVNGYSYIFTKFNDFDISRYRKVYHMFLSGYEHFNKIFDYEKQKQIIHLYPGGKFNNINDLSTIHKETKVISTQPNTSKMLDKLGLQYIECLGSTCLPQNFTINHKPKNVNNKLRICFSNMGIAPHKGAYQYFNICKLLSQNKDIECHYIGSTYGLSFLPENIKFHSPKCQKELDRFYHQNIDVIINVENSSAHNGWPLGVEAMIQGVVLITTDIRRANESFGYTEDMIHICADNDIYSMVKFIEKLNTNRGLLFNMSKACTQHTLKMFAYENQQQKILNILNDE